MDWANNRIRLLFTLGVNGKRVIGKKFDTRTFDINTFNDIDLSKNTKAEDTEMIEFKRGSRFSNILRLEIDDELKTIKTSLALFTTE